MDFITTEIRNQIVLIGLNRVDASNAFNIQMLHELSKAITDYEANEELRCAILFAHGKHFTVGLQLEEVSEWILKEGKIHYPEGQLDPFGLNSRKRKKPLVTAIQGFCFTLGIELALASDIRLAAKSARFTQAEVQRGIAPFGGATFRMVEQFGWGNAMRYLLTGDVFGAEEAYRLGLVQEIVEAKNLLDRALQIAETIASNAPLGIKATLESGFKYLEELEKKVGQDIQNRVIELMRTEDGKEGVQSFLEKRKAKYRGK
ncbi:MAG TPA: crotonase/enoyl-CoA hydratase family protein [Leptospiraceae bacterium]|nr:crotonase/enoyl-CoA hydratase family protein [Leptospiraceae bacterium]HMW04470.1 crotonase/enoyl-CoA hydratase family protein [Leptospiraceae bacterium]HMX31128.1 crotonase/enoyl-CoA hydratase family protein [Leptospiraceae bacterium]HMY30656.1 crotonase/enoyl-CoA hydratase family protein [Leptospiraceae bacterium]HMZ65811.1 crotonase/enoyl-CoA hydratase family protein [Leptospiraceae bacterium]